MKYSSWLFGFVTFVLFVNCFSLKAQTSDSIRTMPEKVIEPSQPSNERKSAFQKDSLLKELGDSIGAQDQKYIKNLKKKKFTPNPQRALWLALVCPGAGQIYNRKYWKLPILYGGLLGCTYAFLWNQQMYKDYSQAYLDIMDNDPNTKSYLDLLPPNYDITGKEDQFKKIFKNKKDFYRRYRDLSIFSFIGVYLLSVVDAYVDAQLSVFDISKDLSLHIVPAVISNTQNFRTQSTFGVGCSLSF
mgnify:FL=1